MAGRGWDLQKAFPGAPPFLRVLPDTPPNFPLHPPFLILRFLSPNLRESRGSGLEIVEQAEGQRSEGARPAPGVRAPSSAPPSTAVGREQEVDICEGGPKGKAAVRRTPRLSQAPCSHPPGVACDEGLGLS